MALEKCLWQYSVRHQSSNCFRYGDACFLKSNPEWSMEVIGFGYNKNGGDLVILIDPKGEIHEFPPQCILQYEYAGLITDREGEYNICLN